jgi:hypothetical protein
MFEKEKKQQTMTKRGKGKISREQNMEEQQR